MGDGQRWWYQGSVVFLRGSSLHLLETELLASVRVVEPVGSDGTSNGVVVADGLGVAGNDDGVGAAAGDLRDRDLPVLDGGEHGVQSIEEGNLLAVLHALARNLHSLTGLKDLGADRQGRESLDWESRVRRGAALDEWSSQGVDLVKACGRVEGVAGGVRKRGGRLNPARMASLGREDAASRGEVVLVRDRLGSAKVGRDAQVLDDPAGRGRTLNQQPDDAGRPLVLRNSLCGRNESLGITCLNAEVVRARLRRLVAQRLRKERYVRCLLSTYLNKPLANPGLEASRLEIVGADLCQRGGIEVVLEVLEGLVTRRGNESQHQLGSTCNSLSY